MSGMAAQAEMLDIVRESVVAQRVIKISGGEAHESVRFDKSANTLRQLIMKQSIAAAASTPITHFVVSIAIGAIIYLAASKTLGEPMPMANFIAFIVAATALVPQIKQLASVNEQIQRGLAASTRVFSLIDAPAETDTGKIALTRANGAVRFEHISLHYPTKNTFALDNVSLSIAPGETIALVGPSGGGKTSLVNLVPRFSCRLVARYTLMTLPLMTFA
ncbi:MAG: ATP-binding cassette domain-containing protein [Gammaproteobacteria bacterium]|nr:ATP-binding cassette domain-containing protein [Gammaproteobacteria bacterium]